MIREPQFYKDTQDVLCRSVHLVSPRPALLDLLRGMPQSDDPEAITSSELAAPVVVMTEEVPFERDIEGWRPRIAASCKEAFLREYLEYYPETLLPRSADAMGEPESRMQFFDAWWELSRPLESIEIVGGYWRREDAS